MNTENVNSIYKHKGQLHVRYLKLYSMDLKSGMYWYICSMSVLAYNDIIDKYPQ